MKYLAALITTIGLISVANATTARDLDFMDGRWQGTYNNSTVVSHYIAGNAKVFVGRTFMKDSNGTTQFVELIRVDEQNGQLVMTPYPMGKKGLPFKLIQVSKDSATFENPANPFPSKIHFSVSDNVLTTDATGTKNGAPSEITYKQIKIPETVDF